MLHEPMTFNTFSADMVYHRLSSQTIPCQALFAVATSPLLPACLLVSTLIVSGLCFSQPSRHTMQILLPLSSIRDSFVSLPA